MKKLFILTVITNLFFANTQAQNVTGTASPIMKAPLLLSTNSTTNSGTQWNVAVKLEMTKGHSVPNAQTFLQKKYASKQGINSKNLQLSHKPTRANPPLMGTNFRGNKTEFLTPTDNGIAISNGGKIVSVDNCTIEYYNADGTPIQQNITWNDFLNQDTSLLFGKYDPRVIYDNKNDRFITLILHGPLDKVKNKIIVAYSKTNNPADGWNIYTLPGNLFNDTTFSDYPNAAINDNELFINLNLFKCDPPYNYGQTVIFQIDLAKGYAGLPNLDYKVWGNNITTSTGLPGFTLVPAPNGLGQSNTDGMHFVSTWPDGDDTNVYVYKITKPLLDTSSQLLQYTYKIPKFYVCANGKIKNPVNGIVDSINTGSSVTQSAFLLDNNIHFTFGADFNNGWCGLNYGRINLNTQTAEVKQFGINGTYLSYPAVASFGNNSLEKTSVLCYVQADTNILPQTCAISIDDAMSFSNPVVIKTGDTIVDILNANNNPGYAERWGDYSGIQRRYNSPSGLPEVWMAGAYGATNARPASYNTWLAQLLNTIYPTSSTQTTLANTQSKVYPNPVIDIFTTEFYNASQSNVQVYLINNNGQILQTMYNGNMPKGKCSLQFNKGKLATGVYALQILQDNKIMHTHKVVMQ